METNILNLVLSNPPRRRAPTQPIPHLPPIFLPSAHTSARVSRTFPAYSVMLGTCEDGLPFVLDLQDPAAGSVLVAGDAHSGKTALMRSLVASAMRLNSPREAQFVLFTPFMEEWRDLVDAGRQSGHCLGAYTGQEREAEQMILELASLAERRRDFELNAPAILLIMDDFTPILGAGFDVQYNLRGLFDQGPLSRIWPFISVNSEWAPNLHYWIDPFRTRLVGKMRSTATAQQIAVHPGVAAQVLQPGCQFSAWLDEQWIRFWIERHDA